jgi:hypothetical protein
MAKYRKKTEIIEATQWFKNGDHPQDESDGTIEGRIVRYYRHPDVSGGSICGECRKRMHDHGWIDGDDEGSQVCPGDFIWDAGGGKYFPFDPATFNNIYELVDELS